ncbi:MAG: hypothetical protein PHD88_03685 [Firmicutes bacterium]|nr:hypothetical protein [Bacillota bacterium]MDD4262880.1 hypothetical protein [Bacillota bacterium]MDD4693492.1 hypothetical protein [Bacillota bacterium]
MAKNKDHYFEKYLLELNSLEELEELLERVYPEERRRKTCLQNRISDQYIDYKYKD